MGDILETRNLRDPIYMKSHIFKKLPFSRKEKSKDVYLFVHLIKNPQIFWMLKNGGKTKENNIDISEIN